MSITLKVKAVSLMLEAQYIKKLENRARAHAKLDVEGSASAELNAWKLERHRKGIIRSESRKTNIARGYLKDYPYKRIENTVKPCNELSERDIEDITKLINRHSPFCIKSEKIKDWLNA